MASRLVTALALVSLVAACGGSPKPSTIDDPRVVLQKVTERLFSVRTVHLKVNLAEPPRVCRRGCRIAGSC